MLEVVVIGAGIAGCTAALALWERGAVVTVLEAERPGAGATGASAGMLAAQYESTELTAQFRLCLESRKRYPKFAARLEELSGHSLQTRWTGALLANLSDAEHDAAAQMVSWQNAAGLRAELLDPEEAEKLAAGISLDAVSYAWFPDDGYLDSQELARALGDALAATDIRLLIGNSAAEISSHGESVSGVVTADGRRLEAECVVLAAGAASGQLRGLPRQLPVRPVRGQILRFPAGAVELGRIVGGHAGSYLVPREDGSVLVGSTMEEVGFDRSITEEGRRTIHAGAARLLPAIAGRAPLEQWAGLRPLSADRLPVLGPEPELPGLFYATGYGRDGILVADLAGRVVADLVLAGESEFDWRPFRPERFGSPPG